jgi:chloramphenicol O-acetyltransferase type A
MKNLNLDNWKRKRLFDLFSKMDYPHFNICGKLDVTSLKRFCKNKNVSFYHSMIFIATKAANLLEEFRYRIIDGSVIIHDSVNASFTYIKEDEVFDFCLVEYSENIDLFLENARNKENMQRSGSVIDEHENRDDLIYFTCLPWIEFTSISHPIELKKVDSIPRISWGKYSEDNGKLLMPFCVQANHSLMDGLHIARYFKSVQEIIESIMI